MRASGPLAAAVLVVDSLPRELCLDDASLSTRPLRVLGFQCARAVEFAPNALNCAFVDVAIGACKFAEVLDSLCAAGLAFEPEGTLEALCNKVEHIAVLLNSDSPELSVTLANIFSLPASVQPFQSFQAPVDWAPEARLSALSIGGTSGPTGPYGEFSFLCASRYTESPASPTGTSSLFHNTSWSIAAAEQPHLG